MVTMGCVRKKDVLHGVYAENDGRLGKKFEEENGLSNDDCSEIME